MKSDRGMGKTSVFLSPEQREWLEKKTIEQTEKLGVEVTYSNVIRALIQKQMDLDTERKKVWNGKDPIPGTPRRIGPIPT